MKIANVTAIPVNIPITVDVVKPSKTTNLSACLVRIETDSGITGWGFTAITEEEVIASAVNNVVAPMLIGLDPLMTEMIWDKLYWLMSPRGQTGYAMHAIAAIDIALWDIKGKALGQPIWKLLGGARSRVPVYATFGFPFFSREELSQLAPQWVANGFDKLKMTVADRALRNRDSRLIAEALKESAARVAAVRKAVGPEVGLYVDANCNLDPFHSIEMARMIEQYDISFFEEPITQNDIAHMADMRRRISIPLACGQNEGLAFRFRDMMVAEAVDVVQPNVVITGGYTQCVKIAGMAAAFNVGIDNGGAWPLHNMHLHAGVSNGGMVEWHYVAVECLSQIYRNFPQPKDGWLSLSEEPGLGFEPDLDALERLAAAGSSGGSGKH